MTLIGGSRGLIGEKIQKYALYDGDPNPQIVFQLKKIIHAERNGSLTDLSVTHWLRISTAVSVLCTVCNLQLLGHRI